MMSCVGAFNRWASLRPVGRLHRFDEVGRFSLRRLRCADCAAMPNARVLACPLFGVRGVPQLLRLPEHALLRGPCLKGLLRPIWMHATCVGNVRHVCCSNHARRVETRDVRHDICTSAMVRRTAAADQVYSPHAYIRPPTPRAGSRSRWRGVLPCESGAVCGMAVLTCMSVHARRVSPSPKRASGASGPAALGCSQLGGAEIPRAPLPSARESFGGRSISWGWAAQQPLASIRPGQIPVTAHTSGTHVLAPSPGPTCGSPRRSRSSSVPCGISQC
jgi:hypothetical protein